MTERRRESRDDRRARRPIRRATRSGAVEGRARRSSMMGSAQNLSPSQQQQRSSRSRTRLHGRVRAGMVAVIIRRGAVPSAMAVFVTSCLRRFRLLLPSCNCCWRQRATIWVRGGRGPRYQSPLAQHDSLRRPPVSPETLPPARGSACTERTIYRRRRRPPSWLLHLDAQLGAAWPECPLPQDLHFHVRRREVRRKRRRRQILRCTNRRAVEEWRQTVRRKGGFGGAEPARQQPTTHTVTSHLKAQYQPGCTQTWPAAVRRASP